LIGTLIYIAGGYFMPFLVYSALMLMLAPFGAKLIPSKPADHKPVNNDETKMNNEDRSLRSDLEQERSSIVIYTPEFQLNANWSIRKRSMNPFKIVYQLLKNQVGFIIISSQCS